MKKILSLLLALMMALSLCACSGGGNSAETYVEKAMASVNPFDHEQFMLYWGDAETVSGDYTAADDALLQIMFKNMTYEIKETTAESDTTLVNMSITNTDMGTIMTEAFSEYFAQIMTMAFTSTETDEAMTEEEMTQMLTDIIVEKVESGEYKTITNETTLTLVETEDGWAMSDGVDETLDAMMGGMSSFADDLENNLMGAFDNLGVDKAE